MLASLCLLSLYIAHYAFMTYNDFNTLFQRSDRSAGYSRRVRLAYGPQEATRDAIDRHSQSRRDIALFRAYIAIWLHAQPLHGLRTLFSLISATAAKFYQLTLCIDSL